ncbi:hypothetical protein [Streptomyces turgidiscabies]|uniref:Uncharacterized protein n=1 Tax=Streptomyces turgidiscabies TaxID=85558 RepID=A0ABU0RTE1_9ACTN|nr:hypothetical protein [Streptomyces turgidiscabies]MDQ0935240.1 hypothetical protein [Streptomyces turgidiscabies]
MPTAKPWFLRHFGLPVELVVLLFAGPTRNPDPASPSRPPFFDDAVKAMYDTQGSVT